MLYKKNIQNNYLIIWAYKEFIRKRRWDFIWYICLKTVSGILGFVPPIFIGRTIDYAINKNGEYVVSILILIMLVLLLDAVISIFESKIEIKINYLVTSEIKKKVIEKITDMELSDIEETDRGEFISRLEDAEGVVQFFIEITSLLFIDLIAFIFALVVMVFISPVLSFICFLNIPVMLIVQTIFGRKIGKKEKEIKVVKDSYYSLIYEIIDAIKEIKIFNLQKDVSRNYTQNLMHFMKLSKDKSDISIKSGFFFVVINGLFQIALLACGCYLIIAGIISVGNYFTFNSYVSRFNTELQSISQFHLKKQMYLVSLSRLHELLFMKSETERVQKPKGKEEKWDSDDIRLENVSFSYNSNDKTLIGIEHFVFPENEISVIVGKNGAGKSTLFDLITNFYPYEGKIYVGNRDMKAFSIEQLRREVCYIQQKPYFFKKTIFENLRLNNKSILFKEIQEACEKVGMHEYICELPQKYETIVSEEGINFSGGQLQRLALARAILSKASIILLDEITSGIDWQGRYILYDVIKDLGKNRTVIVISHDSEINKIADNMLYLASGELRCEEE